LSNHTSNHATMFQSTSVDISLVGTGAVVLLPGCSNNAFLAASLGIVMDDDLVICNWQVMFHNGYLTRTLSPLFWKHYPWINSRRAGGRGHQDQPRVNSRRQLWKPADIFKRLVALFWRPSATGWRIIRWPLVETSNAGHQGANLRRRSTASRRKPASSHRCQHGLSDTAPRFASIAAKTICACSLGAAVVLHIRVLGFGKVLI
jgi:hypothetical protein